MSPNLGKKSKNQNDDDRSHKDFIIDNCGASKSGEIEDIADLRNCNLLRRKTLRIYNEKREKENKVDNHPGEKLRNFAEKHTLGDIRCDNITLNTEQYTDDIQMIMKYAESVHPFKLVIEYCQKFKWPMPEIDTFPLKSNTPLFKTTISVKNNFYKGEAVGIQKRLSKSNSNFLFCIIKKKLQSMY